MQYISLFRLSTMSSQGKFVFVLNQIPGQECVRKNSGVIPRVKLGSKWKMRYPIYGPAFYPAQSPFWCTYVVSSFMHIIPTKLL